MAMMAKMRSLAPWFIITVGGLFILFMILSDSKITDIMMQRDNNIGSVNGQDISYQEFANLLEQYRQFQVNQTGQELSDDQVASLRETVWQNLVNQKLVSQKINEWDLQVSDDEVKETLLGPNPPASVTQYFIDSTGAFNRQAYEAAIFNPDNKQAIIQVEEQVRAELLQRKLQNFINSTIVVSVDDVKQKFVDDNIKMDANYVLVDANTINDSLVTVTDDDIENYYKENKDNYEVQPQRKVKYVLFREAATSLDSSGIRNNLAEIVAKLETDTSSFKTYVEIYSDQPYSKDTLTISQIPRGAQSVLIDASTGDIVGPVVTNEGYAVYRLIDKIRGIEESARASHILVDANNDSLANAVYERVTSGGENFEDVAKEVSTDPGSGSQGGDLGWFAKGAMVKEFSDAVFSGRIGVIQKPVKSQFGWHIIKTTGKSQNNFVVEKIVNKIEASLTTLDELFNNASDFAFLADRDGFEKVANELDYDIVETTNFREDSRTIPGLGANRSLVVFAFENSIGTPSTVFKVAAGYVVSMVSAIEKGGYRPLDEVRATIENTVKREKKKAKTLELAQEIYNSVSVSKDILSAKEINPNAKVGSVQNFSTSGVIQNLGRDYAFVQHAYKMEVNEISEPFVGTKGSYIIEVTRKDAFDSTAFSIQKSNLRETLLNQKKNSLFNSWLTELKENSDIEDKRHLFYR
jgi:peptidyl-prolyl cis-trans isomerase D